MNEINIFFKNNIQRSDPEIFQAIDNERYRQQNQIEMIASENIVSSAVLEAQGSIFTNKYAEGYPFNRYYGGCENVDLVEEIAINRAKKLFNCNYVNVQPHSGAQANQAVFLSLLNPGDTILGMALNSGGHLTHGSKVNLSGKWFNSITYGVRKDNHLIDYDEILEKANEFKPKLILAGASAYSRQIDFSIFREIADKINAYLMVDMAHISGIVAAGLHSNPVEFADVVTSTTHKTLRGGRGGIILSNNIDLGKKFNSGVFPGLQGGPLVHAIAGKAVGFGEALKPEFKFYIKDVLKNANILSDVMIQRGYKIVTDGTDTHLVLVDLTDKDINGNVAELSLENAGIACNKNSVPFDLKSPKITSGIRLGSPAATTRGLKEKEFEILSNLICDVLDGISNNVGNKDTEELTREKIKKLCSVFPIY